MQKKLQFSIAFLILLTGCCALLIKLAYSTNSSDSIVHKWSQNGVVSTAVAIVEPKYPGDRCRVCAIMFGDGYYCQISEGSEIESSTGRFGFSVGIQLPAKLSDGQSLALRSISKTPEEKIRKLEPGEIVAGLYSNPQYWSLKCGEPGTFGTLTVLNIDDHRVTIRVEAKIPLHSPHSPGNDAERTLDLDRAIMLDIVSVSAPASQIPMQFKK
ncbi:MAG: hypothetical protein U0930_06610 [Pirellulales bacterium]